MAKKRFLVSFSLEDYVKIQERVKAKKYRSAAKWVQRLVGFYLSDKLSEPKEATKKIVEFFV